MNLTRIKPVTVTGLSVRTNNRHEMTAEGRIGGLWQGFSEHIAPRLKEGSQVYGVYCRYDGDHLGDFDVVAGTDQRGLEDGPDRVTVTLADSEYLVFPAQGELPQAVIDTWQRIWAFFEQPDCPHRRAYTTDFEHYVTPDRADIYIAVK